MKMRYSKIVCLIILVLSVLLNVKYEMKYRMIEGKIESFLGMKEVKEEKIRTIPLQQLATEQSWENCITKQNIRVDVVFYGDSHTRRSDFRKYFPKVSICNLGCSGDNMDGFIRRVSMIKAVHPRKIFFMGGVNDSKSMSCGQYAEKYDLLFRVIRDSLPDADLIVESLLPLNPCVFDRYCNNDKIEAINEVLKKLSFKYNCPYVDLYSEYVEEGILPMRVSEDGIHLKDENYDKWAQAISPYMIVN